MTEQEQADEARALLNDLHVPWCIGHERNVLAAFAVVREQAESERDAALAVLVNTLEGETGDVSGWDLLSAVQAVCANLEKALTGGQG